MFSLSVPSKTFLIGEYGALNGGPALLLATPPRFVMRSSLCLGTVCRREGLEGQGPASILLKDKAFNDYEFQFDDPHKGRGGLGASSAQYLLLHAFYNWLKFQPTKADRLLSAYRQAVQEKSAVMPSGYDVLAQFKGGLSFIHWKHARFDSVDWPFVDLEVFIIRGPLKVATHTHLQNLKLTDTSEFEALALSAYDSLITNDQAEFIDNVNEFSTLLRKNKLAIPETIELQDWIKKSPLALAVKGCGALGADVVMAVVPMKASASFQNYLNERKLEVVSKMSQRSPGLKVDEMSHGELQSKFESEINYFREEGVSLDVVR